MGRTSIGTGELSSRNSHYGIAEVRDRSVEMGTQRLLNALWREHPKILIRLHAEKPDD